MDEFTGLIADLGSVRVLISGVLMSSLSSTASSVPDYGQWPGKQPQNRWLVYTHPIQIKTERTEDLNCVSSPEMTSTMYDLLIQPSAERNSKAVINARVWLALDSKEGLRLHFLVKS